jgi:hypothetical protein
MKILIRILAFYLFIPSVLLCGIPFLFVNDPNDGRTQEEWKHHMYSKWYLKPYFWCFLHSICGGDWNKMKR